MISNTETFVLLQDRQITMVQLNVGQCIYVRPHCVVVSKPVTGFIEDTDQGCSHSDFLHIRKQGREDLRFLKAAFQVCLLCFIDY